jgi:carbamoyl-phosphate synthase small subunit
LCFADASKSDEELVAMTKNWTIVGKDLLSVVSCKEPYEWKDTTEEEWEFNEGTKTAAAGKKFKVRRTAGAIRGLEGP